ncbi:MAG: ompR [Verrucomicrobiaceae bacterium]|nr:ompR [Verrucomicrobiaceae bacterium]
MAVDGTLVLQSCHVGKIVVAHAFLELPLRPMRVLIVEDEPKMATFIAKALEEEGFALGRVTTGDEALEALMEGAFDVAVMDIMLPGPDGISVLKHYRQKGGKTPILLVSARGHVSERVEGLNAGADDYLPKPFVLAELVARVRALGRRTPEAVSLVLRVADLSMDTITHEVRRGSDVIRLSPREFRLLEFLIKSAGRTRGRMAILEAVWDYHFDPGTNLVDVYIRRLREKIDKHYEPKLVQTEKGVGYAVRNPQA